jgi:hypothetical protein
MNVRLIDAYRRGWITDEEYVRQIRAGGEPNDRITADPPSGQTKKPAPAKKAKTEPAPKSAGFVME